MWYTIINGSAKEKNVLILKMYGYFSLTQYIIEIYIIMSLQFPSFLARLLILIK